MMVLQTSIFDKLRKIAIMSYFKYNVNPSKRVVMDRVLLGLAGLLLGAAPPALGKPCYPSSFTLINPIYIGVNRDVLPNTKKKNG